MHLQHLASGPIDTEHSDSETPVVVCGVPASSRLPLRHLVHLYQLIHHKQAHDEVQKRGSSKVQQVCLSTAITRKSRTRNGESPHLTTSPQHGVLRL